MDISTILPLLGGNSSNPGMEMLVKSMAGGTKPDMGTMMSILNKNGSMDKNTMNLVNVLSTMNANKATKQKSPHGLKPVRAIAPDIYLGRLAKYFGV